MTLTQGKEISLSLYSWRWQFALNSHIFEPSLLWWSNITSLMGLRKVTDFQFIQCFLIRMKGGSNSLWVLHMFQLKLKVPTFTFKVCLFYVHSMEHFLPFTGLFLGLHFTIATTVKVPSSGLWLALLRNQRALASTYTAHFLFPSLQLFWHRPWLFWGTHAICNMQPSSKGRLRPGDRISPIGEESWCIIGETEYQSTTELADAAVYCGISFPIYSPISPPGITFRMNTL